MDAPHSVLVEYAMSYGPWAVLFTVLFYWTLRTNKEREEKYREEIREIRAESEERSRRHYAVLSKFAEKYDIVIDKLNALERKIK